MHVAHVSAALQRAAANEFAVVATNKSTVA
jgi:hypothetical protein